MGVGGAPSYVTYLEDSGDHSSLYAAAAAAAANGHTMYTNFLLPVSFSLVSVAHP